MTLSAPVPADVEPQALAELIADAQWVALPALSRRSDPAPRGARVITIPDRTLSLMDGYADYGS